MRSKQVPWCLDRSLHTHLQASSVAREIPPEVEDELFSRNRFFFEEGFQGIRDALVIVVGLGGVGSHAAHMLVSWRVWLASRA